MSGSCFYKWLFGAENFSKLSGSAHLGFVFANKRFQSLSPNEFVFVRFYLKTEIFRTFFFQMSSFSKISFSMPWTKDLTV